MYKVSKTYGRTGNEKDKMEFNEACAPIMRPQISILQHGFIKGRSTVTNLVESFCN
jgi:hypothetical protein